MQPDEGPDVVGLTEAAAILQCRPARVRELLAKVPHQELANGPIWAKVAVERVADGKTSSAKPPKCVGLKEIQGKLQIAGPNIRKWTVRRGCVPRELALGPVWRERDIDNAALLGSSRWKARV